MIQATLYSREDCHLCHQTQEELSALQAEYPHTLVVVDIDSSESLQKEYGLEVPVLVIGPIVLKAPITSSELRQALAAAAAGETSSPAGNPVGKVAGKAAGHPAGPLAGNQAAKTAYQTSPTWTRSDSLSYWLSRHYLALINSLLALYVLLPFVAPLLLKAGYPGPASILYRMYGATCHQLAYRSFFIFGEQTVYPRQAAGVQGLLTYQQASGQSEDSSTESILAARNFTGNPVLGYKVALCERDIALYGSILLFGIIFALSGRRIPAIPWYIWVIFGLVPVGLDGLSQLFSQPPFNFIPYRESTPFLRMVTGALFGFMTAWFGIPVIDQTMKDTQEMLETKRSKAQAIRIASGN